MQAIMFGKDLHGWVSAKCGRRPNKLAHSHHCIRGQLMNLNLELVKDLDQEITARKVKTSKKQTFEDQDFVVSPRNRLRSGVPTVTNMENPKDSISFTLCHKVFD
jgi:hypothetical protein